VTYKAGLSGVAVIAVDPRNTSRCCPQCGLTDKANRKTQETFLLYVLRLSGGGGGTCNPAPCSLPLGVGEKPQTFMRGIGYKITLMGRWPPLLNFFHSHLC
jgi:hypothetical protein